GASGPRSRGKRPVRGRSSKDDLRVGLHQRVDARVSADSRRRVRGCTTTLSRMADRDGRELLGCLGQLLTRWTSELRQRNDRTAPDEFAPEVIGARWAD